VGLTNSPERLIHLRRNRLRSLAQEDETDYVKLETVRKEVASARRVFNENKWPVIDVTRRSIEETAAAVMQLLEQRPKND
ncbi:MAG: kinase/pyrophosphorylase, partial [Alphaproteobacteria bacterium]